MIFEVFVHFFVFCGFIMSQADIDAFIDSAYRCTITVESVLRAVASGIPINGRHSTRKSTALWHALCLRRLDIIAVLLAVGANTNAKYEQGCTAVLRACLLFTADIVQLLINGGGSVNEVGNRGETVLYACLYGCGLGDARARLGVLLARPELDMDAPYEVEIPTFVPRDMLVATADERVARRRWSNCRLAWMAAIAG